MRPAERARARKQFIENHAQTEYVRPAIDEMRFAAGLLRTHVGACAGHAWPLPELLVGQGQTEIGDVRLAGGIEQDIGGLDVPMHYSVAVRVMQCRGNGSHERRRYLAGRQTGFDSVGQRRPFDVLGDDEAQSVI